MTPLERLRSWLGPNAGRRVGATLVAYTLTQTVWQVSVATSSDPRHYPRWFGGSHLDPRWFAATLLVVLVAWATIKWRPPSVGARAARALIATVRTSLLILLVMLPSCAYIGSHGTDRGVSYRYAMRYDLRNLVAAQDSFFRDSGAYTADLSVLNFSRTTGVAAPSITVSGHAWFATNTHTQGYGVCGIAVDTTNPVDATAAPREPACTRFLYPLTAGGFAIPAALILLGLGIGTLAGMREATLHSTSVSH